MRNWNAFTFGVLCGSLMLLALSSLGINVTPWAVLGIFLGAALGVVRFGRRR